MKQSVLAALQRVIREHNLDAQSAQKLVDWALQKRTA